MKAVISELFPSTIYICMFGGFGCFNKAKMFGLIVNGDFYIRVGDMNKERYLEKGWLQHTYSKKNGTVAKTRYFKVPSHYLSCKVKMKGLVDTSLEERRCFSGRYDNIPKATSLKDLVCSKRRLKIELVPVAKNGGV